MIAARSDTIYNALPGFTGQGTAKKCAFFHAARGKTAHKRKEKRPANAERQIDQLKPETYATTSRAISTRGGR